MKIYVALGVIQKIPMKIMCYYNQRVQNTSCVLAGACLLALHCQFRHIFRDQDASERPRYNSRLYFLNFLSPRCLFIRLCIFAMANGNGSGRRRKAKGKRRKLYLRKNGAAVEAYANAFPFIQWMMLVVMTIATSPALRSAPT